MKRKKVKRKGVKSVMSLAEGPMIEVGCYKYFSNANKARRYAESLRDRGFSTSLKTI